MLSLRSASLVQYHHPDFALDISAAHEASGRSFIKYLEESVQKGSRFSDGETINIGWSLLKLSSATDRFLTIHEPSFKEMPINWIPGAENTFTHLMLQKQICHEIGVEPDFSSLMQAGVVSERMLSQNIPFQMDRHTGEGERNSGWALYEIGKTDAEGVKWVSLYQICLSYPQIIPFLALPVNAMVLYENQEITVSYDSKQINTASNIFLKQIRASRKYGNALFSS